MTPSAPLSASPSGEQLPQPGRPAPEAESARPPLAKPPVRRIASEMTELHSSALDDPRVLAGQHRFGELEHVITRHIQHGALNVLERQLTRWVKQAQLLNFLVRGEQMTLHPVGKKLQAALAFFALALVSAFLAESGAQTNLNDLRPDLRVPPTESTAPAAGGPGRPAGAQQQAACSQHTAQCGARFRHG